MYLKYGRAYFRNTLYYYTDRDFISKDKQLRSLRYKTLSTHPLTRNLCASSLPFRLVFILLLIHISCHINVLSKCAMPCHEIVGRI